MSYVNINNQLMITWQPNAIDRRSEDFRKQSRGESAHVAWPPGGRAAAGGPRSAAGGERRQYQVFHPACLPTKAGFQHLQSGSPRKVSWALYRDDGQFLGIIARPRLRIIHLAGSLVLHPCLHGHLELKRVPGLSPHTAGCSLSPHAGL